MTNNKILPSSDLKRIFTFADSEELKGQRFENNRKHNKIIEPDHQIVTLEVDHFESILPDGFELNDALLDIYSKLRLTEINKYFVKYVALYHFGGWYFDPDVILERSLDQFLEYDNIMFHHEADRLDSRVVMKFEAGHKMLENLLHAIVNNVKSCVNLHDVEWFAGKKLLTAMASHEYVSSIQFLAYDHYINYPGGVFFTSEHERQTDWRILQGFGILEGTEPDFSDMPLRISYDQAGYISEHVQKYKLEKHMPRLKEERPLYFSRNKELNKFC